MITMLPLLALLSAAPGTPTSPPDSLPRAMTLSDAPKSETTALALSAFGTAVPIMLAFAIEPNSDNSLPFWVFMGGAVVGPSLGHYYAGNDTRATLGVVVRGLSAAAFVAGAVSLLEDSSSNSQDTAAALFVGGGILGIGSALVDIGTAPLSARGYNKRRGFQVGLVVSGSGTPGVGFSAGF